MSRRNKIISLVIVLGIVLSVAFTGCGTSESPQNATTTEKSTSVDTSTAPAGKTYNGNDVSSEVKIRFMGVGGNEKDKDGALVEINKKLKDMVNVTLELDSIAWADFGTRYNLVIAGGEEYDVIYAASWTSIDGNARKGAFKDLTGMLEKYAPTISKTWPQDTWDESMTDGKIYMIPSFSNEYSGRGFFYREDLRKKYNVPEIKTVPDMEAYFDAIKKNEEGMFPIMPATDEWWIVGIPFAEEKGYEEGTMFANVADDLSLFSTCYVYQSPILIDTFKVMKSWADKGYWPKDSLANKVASIDSFKAGKAAACQGGYWPVELNYKTMAAEHPDWEIGTLNVKVGGKYYIRPPYNGNGQAILAVSKNPERALMTMDAIYSDEDLWTLCSYGIKGKHYDIDANGVMTLPAGATSTDYNGSNYFSGMRYKVFTPFKEDPSNPNKQLKEEFASISYFPIYNKVRFNSEPVKNEYAAVTAVCNKYNPSLYTGLVSDVDKVLGDYDKEMKAAGSEAVYAELKKQVAAWLAKNK